ncbi:MAG: class IIb bacteriocin, lactobin A/cerein 7B family [Nodularia sp. (in: Bacteria)]|nr:MAG: class IIb bacteriocin, lactobin A/cerein 7B family [Nodularia sp. (in: cyanobacteria)]
MASITVSNLYPLGSDLFMDSESFMDALNDNELAEINGGVTPAVITTIATKWFIGAAVGGAIVGSIIYW